MQISPIAVKIAAAKPKQEIELLNVLKSVYHCQGRREGGGGARGATCPGPQPKGGPDLRDETKFPIVYCDMTSPLTPIYNRSLYREENVAWQIVLL